MTAQPLSQAEREDVAREVLAEEAERAGMNGTAEWLRAGCPDRFPQWLGDDEVERREVAGRIAAMLAFSDREHATPRSMPEEVVEAPSEDWLADVIDDSLDMGWTGRVGARAIIARWNERND